MGISDELEYVADRFENSRFVLSVSIWKKGTILSRTLEPEQIRILREHFGK